MKRFYELRAARHLRAKQPRSWTNEYVRHGTHMLLAALEIANGKVLAEMKRRTSVNFLRFMNQVVGHYIDLLQAPDWGQRADFEMSFLQIAPAYSRLRCAK